MQFSELQKPLTLTLTLDRVIRHTVVHRSSTSIYIPNFIEIGKAFCGRTYGRTDVHTYWQTDISPLMLLGGLGGVDLIKIATSRQRLDLSPRNLARWRGLTLVTIPIAATLMQPICAIMNFSTDSLQHVGCCTSVLFLLLTTFLRIIWAIYSWLCFHMIILQ